VSSRFVKTSMPGAGGGFSVAGNGLRELASEWPRDERGRIAIVVCSRASNSCASVVHRFEASRRRLDVDCGAARGHARGPLVR
jgi:hypothetical protein